MNNAVWPLGIALAVLTMTCAPAFALPDQSKEFKNFKVIGLKNGPNTVDINGDGSDDLIFIAWRENYNAHGFDIFTFYIKFTSDINPKESWHLVPFFNSKGVPDKLSLTTAMGADCMLSDVRVVRSGSDRKAPVAVVIGVRELGNSYADDASVQFLVYELKSNKDEIPGEPPFYFEHVKTIQAKRKYCDINEAFEKELGLGWYRTDRTKQ